MTYFDELLALIDNGQIVHNYYTVLTLLYNTNFVPVIDEDNNRIIDALTLRSELCNNSNESVSVLEVMVALAKRCYEDIMYGYIFDGEESSISYWFWIMMHNSGLDQLKNNELNFSEILQKFNSIIGPILNRSYNYNGTGGFFPLHHPEMDQRYCELWYQLNAYLLENYPF